MLRATAACAVIAVFAPVLSQGQPPTYSEDVSRIIRAKCHGCHRDGDIAPFALNTYDDAVVWSEDIKRVISSNIMPPWKPVAGFGEFRDARALTAQERQTILDWVASGTPEGAPERRHAAAKPIEWPLGTPDVILQVPQAFTPARGRDVYRCFVLPDAGFDSIKYLSAIDVLPGNRRIVHHVILYADTTGTAVALDGKDGQPGYSCFGGPGLPLRNITSIFSALDALGGLGGWAPGQRTHFLPDGVGIMLPPGARIVMQVHYYPAVTTGPDQSKIGLYVARSDIRHRLYNIPIVNMGFRIAPETTQDVIAKFPPFPLPISAQAISIYPHMHLLGRRIKADLIDSGGGITPLIYEDDWDFNWQGAYTFRQPVPIPNYSTVKATCSYDNTSENPRNPHNPPVEVGWGERTTDEMCVVFLGVTLDNDPLTLLRSAQPVP